MRSRLAPPSAMALGLALAIGAATAGCSTHMLQRPVERRLRHRLTTLIGPAERYRVRISKTNDADLVVGRIGRLEVTGEGVLIGGQLPIEHFEMQLERLRYTGGPIELLSVRSSMLLVEISEASLNHYLAEYHARDGVQAHFANGEVTINLIMNLFGVPTPIHTTGTLTIAEGRRIVFRADQVEAPNAPLLGPGKELVQRQLNPLVDMQQLGVPVRLTDLEVNDGHIVVRGAADLPVEDGQQSRKP